MNYDVTLEAAVPVYDIEENDQATRIAISKTGKMLNPDLDYVEIDTVEGSCDDCGTEQPSSFVAADKGLVRLDLSMTVFNVNNTEHAERVAKKEIGQQLDNIPLELSATQEQPGDDSDDSDDSDDTETEYDDHSDEPADSATDADDTSEVPGFEEFRE